MNARQFFTLADIIGILPKEVNCEYLEIGFCGEDWCAAYDEIMASIAPELIDALYSLLVWCLEKGIPTDSAPLPGISF